MEVIPRRPSSLRGTDRHGSLAARLAVMARDDWKFPHPARLPFYFLLDAQPSPTYPWTA